MLFLLDKSVQRLDWQYHQYETPRHRHLQWALADHALSAPFEQSLLLPQPL